MGRSGGGGGGGGVGVLKLGKRCVSFIYSIADNKISIINEIQGSVPVYSIPVGCLNDSGYFFAKFQILNGRKTYSVDIHHFSGYTSFRWIYIISVDIHHFSGYTSFQWIYIISVDIHHFSGYTSFQWIYIISVDIHHFSGMVIVSSTTC